MESRDLDPIKTDGFLDSLCSLGMTGVLNLVLAVLLCYRGCFAMKSSISWAAVITIRAQGRLA